MTSEAPHPSAEQPADGDRTNQVPPPHGAQSGQSQYTAPASQPGQAAAQGQVSPAQPGLYGGAPGGAVYGQGSVYGQVSPASPAGRQEQQSQSGWQNPPQPGQPRTAASASVPMPSHGPATPGGEPSTTPAYRGPAAPPHSAQSTTYGSPTQPTSAAAQGNPGQEAQPGQASRPGQYGPGSQPAYGGQPGHPVQGGYPSQGDQQTWRGAQASGGQPGGYPPQPYGPPPPTQAERPGFRPEQPAPGRGQPGMAPTGGWPYVEQQQQAPAPPARTSRRWLVIVLAIVGGIIVLGGAATVGWVATHRGDPYQVGACVKQQGDSAVIVDCSSDGAYKIVSRQATVDQCSDQTQPSIVLKGGGKADEVACLAPAAS